MAAKEKNPLVSFWNAVKPSFLSRNAVGSGLGDWFRRRGPRMDTAQLGQVILEDRDLYTGILYAAIRNRANHISELATNHIESRLRDVPEDDPKQEQAIHPYKQIIDSSPSFSNYFFYAALSTYLDMPKGVAYLLAVRNYSRPGTGDPILGENLSDQTVYGDVQEFQLLNPFNITRVSGRSGEVGGYVETTNGQYRTIPEEQMIVIHSLNPFNLNEGFGMTEASKDDQYTLRQAGSTTRSALKNQVGQRGLVSTGVILEDEEFANFKAAVEEQSGPNNAGKFLYGNGPGAINYADMAQDMNQLALEAVTNIGRENLFAVAGVSKTLLGIEQSGVTRETSNVQRDLFTSNHAIPQLQIIIDALNQDYRNAYPDDYEAEPIDLYIDSPLKRDFDAEHIQATTLQAKSDAALKLVNAGYDPDEIAAALELPEMKHTGDIPSARQPAPTEPNKVKVTMVDDEVETHDIHEEFAPVIRGQQSTLKNAVSNVQRKLFAAASKKLNQNKVGPKKQDTVVNKVDRERATKELTTALSAFYLSTIALFAKQTMNQREEEYGLKTTFEMTQAVKSSALKQATRAATSHINTVTSDIYAVARQGAEEGLTNAEIASKLSTRYTEVSDTRAETIARSETNRSVTDSQFEADKQFLDQHDLRPRAYKKWVTHSANPCDYCEELESQDPIPFDDNFLDAGDTLTVSSDGKDGSSTSTLIADYGDIEDGNAHPNCSCSYELIIE